jgi:hypothetical protein
MTDPPASPDATARILAALLGLDPQTPAAASAADLHDLHERLLAIGATGLGVCVERRPTEPPPRAYRARFTSAFSHDLRQLHHHHGHGPTPLAALLDLCDHHHDPVLQ